MNLVKEFLLLKAKVDKLYCQLIAKSPDEQDPTVPNHVKTIKQTNKYCSKTNAYSFTLYCCNNKFLLLIIKSNT